MDDGRISPSRHAAPWFGSIRLNYINKGLTLQLYSHFSGQRKFEDLAFEEQRKTEIYAQDSQGRPYSPSWYTLNIKALYQLSQTFTLSGGIENITDQRYRTYSSGIAAAGRNYLLSLKVGF